MSPFSGMNRADRRLSSDDAEEILSNGKVGTLSVSGVEGYPYGIPMNYVYDRGLLQFHTSSRDGLLLRSLRSNPRASFCVFEMYVTPNTGVSLHSESFPLRMIRRRSSSGS